MTLASRLLGLAAALTILAGAAPGRAETLRVLAGGAVTGPLRQIGDDYARTTGVDIVVVSSTTGVLQQRLRAGEAADLAVITAAGMDGVQADGLIQKASRVDLARGLIGVGVRAGAPAPDLSSLAAFKAALLAARSIAYVSPAAGGTSGAYFEGVLQRLGIGPAMKAKTLYRTQGSEVAAAVADGEAELGVTFTSELSPNAGVRVAGPLPAEIQSPTVYAGAITASTPHGVAAAAFLRALQTPAAAAVIARAGLQPLAGR